MKYSNNVRTTLSSFLRIADASLVIIGMMLMIGGAGALDFSVETGSMDDPKTVYIQMIVGLFFLMAGLVTEHWRQRSDERETFREQDQEIHREFRRLAG